MLNTKASSYDWNVNLTADSSNFTIFKNCFQIGNRLKLDCNVFNLTWTKQMSWVSFPEALLFTWNELKPCWQHFLGAVLSSLQLQRDFHVLVQTCMSELADAIPRLNLLSHNSTIFWYWNITANWCVPAMNYDIWYSEAKQNTYILYLTCHKAR